MQKYGGGKPSTEDIKEVSKELGLNPSQTYKWYWDTSHRIEKDKKYVE